LKEYSPYMLKDSKKIAPNAFEYRLNLHKKTSTYINR